MTVAAGPVIEDFNVIEDIGPGQIPGFIDAFSDPFFFQRTEERFGYRIDAPMSRAGDWHMRGHCCKDRCVDKFSSYFTSDAPHEHI